MLGRAVIVLLLVGAAGSVRAQTPPSAGWLTRSAVQLSSNRLSGQDPRFWWDAVLGATVDVVDYRQGRVTVRADYAPVLGRERRPFDPTQAAYTLEASASYRAPHVELAGVVHHVSRHLSDRPKAYGIDWNTVGVRARGGGTRAGVTFDGQGEVAVVVQHAYVDYTGLGQIEGQLRRSLRPHTVGLFVHGTGTWITVDAAVAGRGLQTGWRLDGGLRLEGRGAALELFAGRDARIDADPVDRQPGHFWLAGFRLVAATP